MNIDEMYKKIQSSPYWRDDFEIEQIDNASGKTVVKVKGPDQEPSTILAIAKLNEVLQQE